MRGKAISKFRSPNALPRAPTPLGTERSVTSLMCNTVDFCLYAAVFRVGRCADLGSWVLRHLQWNVILIWFPNSSIFIMNRYANPSSGLFGISAKTLRRYSYTPTIPGQDAPRPLPSPARVLSFFLSAGSVSQRERISVRAVAEEG